MKRIMLFIVTVFLNLSYLNAGVPENYLYKANKMTQFYLLTVADSHDSAIKNSIYRQMSGIEQKLLDQVNHKMSESQKLTKLPIDHNISTLVLYAGEISHYYSHPTVADKLSLTLHNDTELLLIHIYLYALTNYKDPIKRLYFYLLISDGNALVAQALENHTQDFEKCIWQALNYFVKIPKEQYELLAHTHELYTS